jgi:hypothetical protein
MPAIGEAAMAVLKHNDVDVVSAYPECCGMPQLENGDLADVSWPVYVYPNLCIYSYLSLSLHSYLSLSMC